MPLTLSSVVRRMVQSTYSKIEKHCGQSAALLDSCVDFKRDVTITNTAGNVAKEASSDLKNVNWDSVDS